MCGVQNDQIQKRLLAEDGLTVTRALEIAQGMEATDKNSKELQNPKSEVLQVISKPRKSCYRCGCNHSEKECKFREAICYKSGRQGHIAPVCH